MLILSQHSSPNELLLCSTSYRYKAFLNQGKENYDKKRKENHVKRERKNNKKQQIQFEKEER